MADGELGKRRLTLWHPEAAHRDPGPGRQKRARSECDTCVSSRLRCCCIQLLNCSSSQKQNGQAHLQFLRLFLNQVQLLLFTAAELKFVISLRPLMTSRSNAAETTTLSLYAKLLSRRTATTVRAPVQRKHQHQPCPHPSPYQKHPQLGRGRLPAVP